MINANVILTTRQKWTGEIEPFFPKPMTCPTRLPKTGLSKMYSKVELEFIQLFGNVRNIRVTESNDLLKNKKSEISKERAPHMVKVRTYNKQNDNHHKR